MDSIIKSTLLTLLCSCYVSISDLLPLNEIEQSFELSIIHFSDFHARYLPIAPSGGLCYDKEKCVGGIARVSTIVKYLKKVRPNAIFLNAGDCFQGTLYYDVHRVNITTYFMNKLPHDAITIGNHDFDDNVSGLASYMKQLRAPVVLANIDQREEPILWNLYTNSTIIRKGDKDIGIIGLIFSDTDKISTTTGKVKFLNEVESVNLEAKKLKAKGVNIIIVLSHCGIDHDKIIASNCPDVDVIVGGHSHILLYNGEAPSKDIVYDKYPIVVTQKDSNRKVLIVHAGAFTKYMGDIRIVFDHNDEVSFWKGNPIYLNEFIKEDKLIVDELQPWSIDVNKIGKRLIGETKVFLNGSCSTGECNLANFITDAMVDLYAANASIALTSAINIQNSIPVGPLLYEDLYMTLPYNNTWDLLELQGKDLLQVLENNVAIAKANNLSFDNISLLHWSGLKVTYNLRKTKSKLISVKVRDIEDGKFKDIDVNKWYHIVVTEYLTTNAFKIIAEKNRNHIAGVTHEVSNLVTYVKKIKIVDTKIEGRMIFV